MKFSFKNIIIWLFLVAWFFVVTGFILRSNEQLLCKEIKINIPDSLQCSFIKEIDVRNVLIDADYDIQGYPVEEINTRALEDLIENNPYVKNAEVYINIEGSLFVEIHQRKPILRIMPNNATSYYIDHDLVVLPISDGYAPNVLLLNGYVDFKTYEEAGVKRLKTEADSELESLLAFSKLVNEHPLWSKQIVQLYRGKNGDFEIIPRVGAHQVIFGSMENFQKKLTGLESLYNQGFKKYGWNNYEIINLKYSNQIICTKR